MIAIESHRPALLKSLLQRSDVVFKDMFWAPYPSNWSGYCSVNLWGMEIPKLHHFGSDSDLSFVGREDCGQMRVDVELQTPFDVLRTTRTRIFWCRSHWWRVGIRPSRSTRSTSSGHLDNSTIRSRNSITRSAHHHLICPALFCSAQLHGFGVCLRATGKRWLFLLIGEHLRWCCASPHHCRATRYSWHAHSMIPTRADYTSSMESCLVSFTTWLLQFFQRDQRYTSANTSYENFCQCLSLERMWITCCRLDMLDGRRFLMIENKDL